MIDLLSAPKKYGLINVCKIRVLWKIFIFANAKITIKNILINKFLQWKYGSNKPKLQEYTLYYIYCAF
jgi:hypothetical protein